MHWCYLLEGISKGACTRVWLKQFDTEGDSSRPDQENGKYLGSSAGNGRIVTRGFLQDLLPLPTAD